MALIWICGALIIFVGLGDCGHRENRDSSRRLVTIGLMAMNEKNIDQKLVFEEE